MKPMNIYTKKTESGIKIRMSMWILFLMGIRPCLLI